jgi:hypothetical protein
MPHQEANDPMQIVHAPLQPVDPDPLPVPRLALVRYLLARPLSRSHARNFVRVLEFIAATSSEPEVRQAADTILNYLLRRGLDEATRG